MQFFQPCGESFLSSMVTHDEIGERTNDVRHHQHDDQAQRAVLPA
jgi:hypothetical protein